MFLLLVFCQKPGVFAWEHHILNVATRFRGLKNPFDQIAVPSCSNSMSITQEFSRTSASRPTTNPLNAFTSLHICLFVCLLVCLLVGWFVLFFLSLLLSFFVFVCLFVFVSVWFVCVCLFVEEIRMSKQHECLLQLHTAHPH